MKFQLRLAVISGEASSQAVVVGSESPQEICESYIHSNEDYLDRICEVIIEDDEKATHGVKYLPATAYQALLSIDALSDIPQLHDLLMFFFSKGFEEGTKRAAEFVELQRRAESGMVH